MCLCLQATVLIETLPAAFQMDEIMWELRAHSAGLNCGRWDYIFSFIKTFRADPKAIMPDRSVSTKRTSQIIPDTSTPEALNYDSYLAAKVEAHQKADFCAQTSTGRYSFPMDVQSVYFLSIGTSTSQTPQG